MKKVDIENKIIIAASDKFFLPQLSLGKTDSDYYVIQSQIKRPITLIKDVNAENGVFAYGSYQKVSQEVYNTLKEAIQLRESYSMLDNYTFLIAYCIGKSLCLFEEGVFCEEDKRFL